MKVRDATADDLHALARLNGLVQAVHVQMEPHRYRPMPQEQIRAALQEKLLEPEVWPLLAEQDGLAVGYALLIARRRPGTPFTLPFDSLHIDQIGVAPGARRAGVGRALMRAAEDKARALGLGHLDLGVRGVNASALAFYQALGYTPTHLNLTKELP